MKFQLRSYLLIISFFVSLFAHSYNEKLKFSHYTNENGLPSSYVKSICQDHYGFIWIASRSSICRFDGQYFKTFYAHDDDGHPFDLWGKKFFTYHDSILIAQTTDYEYYIYDFALEVFKPYDLLNNEGMIWDLVCSDLGFWIIGQDSLYFLDEQRGIAMTVEEKIGFANLPENTKILNLREKNNKLFALSNLNSFFIFDLEQKRQRQFKLPEGLNSTDVTIFFLDNNNYAWLCGYETGIYRIDLTNGRCMYFSNHEKGNRYILHNLVHCINEDNTGRVWIGTENGLCVWSPYSESFEYHQYDINNPQGLNTNPIYDLFCDNKGNMWLGTYFGGINFWNSNPTFFKIWQPGTSEYHIGGNAVSCIREDHEGNIWIGTEDMGINKYDIQTSKIEKITSGSGNTGLSFNNVHCLLFENDNKLWIGTYTHGINILNLKTKRFEYLNTTNEPNLPSNNVYHMLKSGDSIYIAAANGLAIYDIKRKTMTNAFPEVLNGSQVDYIYEGTEKIWISTKLGVYFLDKQENTLIKFNKVSFLKNINFVKTDSKNRLWIGDSREGLCCCDEISDSIFQYNEKNGFPFSWIFSMEEGVDGTFWVSGDKGLVKFNPELGTVELFNRESDIPFEQFNFRASYKDAKGNIYFGGNNGMISFGEAEEYVRPINNKVIFRGMQLFNQPLVPGNLSPLSKSLNMHPEVHFKYKQNVFTIEYSGLNFQNDGKCEYAYYLENFEKTWNHVGNRDFASYTNLSPGKYMFHVKALGDKPEAESNINTLKIVVEPPFWLSQWGFVLYSIVVLLLLGAVYLVSKRIQNSKALAVAERREREYSNDLNNFKLEFFTNISHELRTPLTLILGPLSRILEEEKLAPALSKKMKGIKNNAHRLLMLINQLLEFRKLETGKEKLKVSHQNIKTLLKDVEEAFLESAESKGIQLRFDEKNIDKNIWIDCQKLEKILVNLISNALKYTKEGGEVTVFSEVITYKDVSKKKVLELTISDTGVGIESSKIPQIFNRFYRAEGSELGSNGGSGIGLALVNSLVQLHKGTIKVESNVGKGSEFIVEIPVSRKAYQDTEIILATDQYIVEVEPVEDNSVIPSLKDEMERLSQKPSVLVVDDNRELLEFITETLASSYTVITAVDGTQGLEKVMSKLPDLIISDVMMPGIDGFELARKIKSDIQTSHIPIVLLTAKSGEENEYEGLQTGADYYIEKPFLPHILLKLISNVLDTRRSLIQRFKADLTMLPTEVALSSSDKDLIEKVTDLIRNNIDIPNLDVSYIVNEIGISRSLLHVKLKKLTGCSATEFIRSIRLREAVKLIAEGKCNISEAAYQTGFSSPAYFSRRFKEYFGKSPRDYFDD